MEDIMLTRIILWKGDLLVFRKAFDMMAASLASFSVESTLFLVTTNAQDLCTSYFFHDVRI